MEPVNGETLQACISAIQSGAVNQEQLYGALSQTDSIVGATLGGIGYWLVTQGRAWVAGSCNGPVGRVLTAVLFGEWGGAETSDGLNAPVSREG